MNKNQILNKKYIINYGGQLKYYKKKSKRQVHKTEDYSDQISQPLPPILQAARINTQLENINLKYRTKPHSNYTTSTPNNKNTSLPLLKILPNDNEEQIKQKINSCFLQSNQAKVIIKNDFLKQNMIGYSKVSTIMII
ncbi:unnamed protein product [Paramecium pentaurelia]|uniref:Uncharacterized protein n=1 Tax=Paramecium pentaurelia TaxID=43138 RepID=A0A8S1TFM5_9CILI|nr:unnamed protein product [Paramecium pentaurelia]